MRSMEIEQARMACIVHVLAGHMDNRLQCGGVRPGRTVPGAEGLIGRKFLDAKVQRDMK